MEDNVIIVLLTVSIAALIAVFVLAEHIYKIKIRLAEISDVLDDIARGNDNRRILAYPEDITAAICYKINAIVKGYRDQILELNQLAEANRRLMTSLSHDVRTPLTSIIGYLDVAVRKNDDQRAADIEIARQKAHDMKDYVDTLFVWCKLNSGEESFHMEQLDLAELTRNILQDWLPVFENKKLIYDIDTPDNPVTVMVDKDAYMRILNNLIQNTLRHSGATQISIAVFKNDRNVNVSVTDNGCGISKNDLPHVFERLYKCDPSRSGGGSGLGLSIVYHLTTELGGRVSAKSKDGKGSKFLVTFPAD